MNAIRYSRRPSALILGLAIGAWVAPGLRAQTVQSADEIATTTRDDLHSANMNGDVAALGEIGNLLERALVAYPDNAALLHNLGYAHYRMATTTTDSDEDAAESHLVLAQEYFERATELHDWPESHALLASVYGMRIGSNMLRGMRLGPKADAASERAIELDATNPRVWLLAGTGNLYKPRMFGGGVDKAIEQFNKSLELFEADEPASPRPNWGRAEIHAWLGLAHVQKKQPDEARAAFERALEIEPDFGWVSVVLLPQLDRAASGG